MAFNFRMAFLLLASFSLASQAETLTLYTWANYLDQGVIENFEESFGHDIEQIYFDVEDQRDLRFTGPQSTEYDLILMDEYSIKMFGLAGFLRNFDDLEVLGIENHGTQYIESCAQWGVPYGWNTIGIAYRSSSMPSGVSSWKTLFNPPQDFGRGIVMPLDEMESSAAVLLASDYGFDVASSSAFNAALKTLQGQFPFLIRFGNGHTYANLKGELSDMRMTLAHSRDLHWLRKLTGQDDWEFVVPDEGGLARHDCWTASNGRPFKKAALDFLSFINQPEVAAENAEGAGFSSTNILAQPFFSEAYLSNTVLNPSEDTLNRIGHIEKVDENFIRQRNLLMLWVKMLREDYEQGGGGFHAP